MLGGEFVGCVDPQFGDGGLKGLGDVFAESDFVAVRVDEACVGVEPDQIEPQRAATVRTPVLI